MVMEVPSAPVITSISPTIGGVSGGTLLYIYGSGFSTDQYMGGNAVFIGDTPCDVISYYSNTQQVSEADRIVLDNQLQLCDRKWCELVAL